MHPLTSFGTAFFDINHDGADDVVAVNGAMKLPDTAVHIPAFSDRAAYWKIFAEPNMIFLNAGNGKFTQHVSRKEMFSARVEVSRGLCTGDIDNDGDLDMLLLNTAAKARLYRNVAKKTGSWLRLRAIEPAFGGRDAYGARVTVRSGGKRWTRWISPSSSYLSSHDPIAHVGLGSLAAVDCIEVRWPDGSDEIFPGGPVNQLRVLAHGSATASVTAAARHP
jgi:hypothetical protein